MQRRLALAGSACFGLILAVVSAVPLGDAPPRAGSAAPAPAPTPAPELALAASEPVLEEPRAERAPRVHVMTLRFPVAGAVLPAEPQLLPGSTRGYRGGFHEGVDFPADAGTPVLAAADGLVVRADVDFADWTPAERGAALAEAVALGYTPERTLDRIRGRQVWIDHGRELVTRYAHLQDVAARPGAYVLAGETVGMVGSSGYPEGGPHLHFEIRIGDRYYGEDLPPDALLRALQRVFR